VQNESLHFAAIFSACFCWIEGAWDEVVVVAVSFEISMIPLIKIFSTDLLLCLADLIHWGFLDAFQLYV
jgi:hypothetical protein